MIKKEGFPEEGELVVGTVRTVQNFGAFVTLDEYKDKEGFIHISEVAPGWIKRIRDHVREGQRVVCKVMHVDEKKGHIDLSLKRVNEHQRREKIQEWKNEQKASKLFEMLAKRLGRNVEDCYEEFGKRLIEKFGSLYASFEETVYDPQILEREGFSGDWIEEFKRIAKENIQIPFVKIKGLLKVTSPLPDGVEHIRKALELAEQSGYDDVSIEVTYRGAPSYLITVKAPDYKIAEEELKRAVERVQNYMKNGYGTCEFSRHVEK